MMALCLHVWNPPVIKQFKASRSRDHHMTTHHLKDYRYPCTEKVCTKGYETQDDLDWHRFKVHNIGKPVICDLCNKQVPGKKYLEIRQKLTCGQPMDIKCRVAQCKKKFKAQFLMDSHYVKWHSDQEKVFVKFVVPSWIINSPTSNISGHIMSPGRNHHPHPLQDHLTLIPETLIKCILM